MWYNALSSLKKEGDLMQHYVVAGVFAIVLVIALFWRSKERYYERRAESDKEFNDLLAWDDLKVQKGIRTGGAPTVRHLGEYEQGDNIVPFDPKRRKKSAGTAS